MFDSLLEIIDKSGNIPEFTKPISLVIEECFGIYYDNPEKLEDETHSRAIYGMIIPE